MLVQEQKSSRQQTKKKTSEIKDAPKFAHLFTGGLDEKIITLFKYLKFNRSNVSLDNYSVCCCHRKKILHLSLFGFSLVVEIKKCRVNARIDIRNGSFDILVYTTICTTRNTRVYVPACIVCVCRFLNWFLYSTNLQHLTNFKRRFKFKPNL